jgi:Flp pilus assembly protein TadD
MNVTISRGIVLATLFGFGAVANAQEADESVLDKLDNKNAPVVQQSEAPGARELREALRRIALQPNDTYALIDAGNAALLLDDGNAALNFFSRANALQPNNGRIKAGLAAATVRTENPFEALRLFDEAVKLGVSERTIAADRAMAFDLLGNFDRAQQDYQLARTGSFSDDLVIKQAISLSLAGRKNDADAMLVPLLKKDSSSAWRARAFMLAARGDLRESTKVAQGFLDPGSAQRIERYLRLMPQLTGAQQAAAIHLGHFPANNIGRDSDDVRRVASTIPPVTASAGDGRLIPSGNPLGPRRVDLKGKPETKQERKAREKAEQAAAKTQAAKVQTTTAKNNRTRPPVQKGLSTDVARAKIEEAAKASMALVTARDLPVPDGVRASVKVVLPPAPEATPKVASNAVVFQPAPPPKQNVMAAPATTLPAQAPPPIVKADSVPEKTVAMVQPSPAPAVPLSRANAAIEVTRPPTSQAPVQNKPGETPAQVNGPGFESLSTPTAAAPKAAPQGPMPDGAVMVQPIAPDSEPAASIPQADVPPLPPVEKAPAPFDLGAVVGSIEIPEAEQKSSITPVDLKKIKQAAPKAAADIDPKTGLKIKPGTKTVNQPARIWVQIATGNVSAVGYDYKGWVRKKPELFKGREGWTAIWGKTGRLLVGPFATIREANKWTADFAKAGGKGFVWNSENGAVVEKLKVK